MKLQFAVATVNVLSSEVYERVTFTGSNSTDDQEISSYEWNFKDGSSSFEADPSHIFTTSGTYNVELTIIDEKGLIDSTSLTIIIAQADETGNTSCITNGGFSGDEGYKQWCWRDLEQEVNSAGTQNNFSNSQLARSAHHDPNGTFVQNGRLYFSLDPLPIDERNKLNYRQEIRDTPSDVSHPVGTEQWWGFDYRFADDYIADELPWMMWQTHGDFSTPSNPMTAIELAPTNYLGNINSRGELVVSNSAFSTENPKKIPLGIIPRAGQTLRIVIHIVWGDNNTGLFQIWVDGVLVYDQKERTVYVEQPEGGYWKLGIYKWRWQSNSNINSSAALGISELNTSIGALRVIKKSPANSSYLSNEYNTVRPR